MQENKSVWLERQKSWAFAYGKPAVSGVLKQQPEDFVVTEVMDVEPSGEGEHVWLHISKRLQNTEQVAKALARFSGVAYRDVGYSGMKDLQAITHQWFSVWLPKAPEPDWSEFLMQGVVINETSRHNRKIKRGTHQANHFSITIEQLSGDVSNIEKRLQNIAVNGVPNYFGKQRFGYGFSNLDKALHMFGQSSEIDATAEPKRKRKGRKKNDNHLRGIVLSAARSWLFNQVLSERIEKQNWQSSFPFEPLNLNGSGSCFKAPEEPMSDAALLQRLESLDVHPTGPMWGKEANQTMADCSGLAALENEVLAKDVVLLSGLEKAGLQYQRRALRLKVDDFQWLLSNNKLEVKFNLRRGQFATSVVREIVNLANDR